MWPVVFCCSKNGDGAFKCSLYCSSNVLADSPCTHHHIQFGKEVLTIFRKFERINRKICDYKNHERLSLICLSKGVTLVSLKLKNNIRTHKSDCLIQKAEKSLLNERIRNINNILDHHEHDRYLCSQKISAILGPDQTKECKRFVEDLKERS